MSEAHQPQRYRVIDRLASGGMAEVFVAESAGLEGFKKRVAIKRVLPHLSQKKRFISMFLDEARLSAALSHSNCVQVFDIGIGDDAYFIVMEYVDGADLKGVVEYLKKDGKPFPLEAAVLICERICEGLAYAHDATGPDGKPLHIVHRDMSPPNVLITRHGEVKIVDFGLAKATSQLEKSEAGIIKGKFGYLSPEAAMGEEVDHRTDIFAVGIILWELLAGRRLFLGETDFQTVKQVQAAQIPPISSIRPDVPKALDAILAKALARDRAQRYASARALGKDLTEFLYRNGKAVSAFEVSDLVRGAMKLRLTKTPEKGSLIESLIAEALLEFRSLDEDEDPAKAARQSHPNEPIRVAGFTDIGRWAEEMARTSAPSGIGKTSDDVMRMTLPQGVLGGLGNLAALEDDDGHGDVGRTSPVPLSPRPGALPGGGALLGGGAPAGAGLGPTGGLPPPHAAAAIGASAGAALAPSAGGEAKGGGALKALLVVAVLAIAAAGAWFGGLIPR
jgi:serine/threonine-protein kinase